MASAIVSGPTGFANLCWAWIEQQLGIFQGGNADTAGAYYQQSGKGTTTPSVGDLVFFGPSQANGYQGHAGVLTGNGNFLSVWSDGLQHIANVNQFAQTNNAPVTGYASTQMIGGNGAANKAQSLIQGAVTNLLQSGTPLTTTELSTTSTDAVTDPMTGVIIGTGPSHPGPTATPPSSIPKAPGADQASAIPPETSILRCPPVPPENNGTPILGGAINVGQQAIYISRYAMCGIQSVWDRFTQPGYWWRGLLVLGGGILIALGLIAFWHAEEGNLKRAVA